MDTITVMTVISSVIGATALLAWVLAAREAIAVIRMAPRGRKVANYMRLGWWNFAAIEAELGADIAPHLRNYKRAFVAFFAAVLVMFAVAAIFVVTQQS